MVDPTVGYSFIQSFTGNRFLDLFMIFSAEALVLLVPITLVYLWFQGEEGKTDSLLGFTAVVTGILSTYALGLFYFHQPPQYQGFETILTKELENAFPSQHTATMFSLVWLMIYRGRKRISSVLLVAAVLTGIGRVYTGLHFPVDIIGGVGASLVGFGTAYIFEDRIEKLGSFAEDIWSELSVF